MLFELCKRVEDMENIVWCLRKDAQSIRFATDLIAASCDHLHPCEDTKDAKK